MANFGWKYGKCTPCDPCTPCPPVVSCSVDAYAVWVAPETRTVVYDGYITFPYANLIWTVDSPATSSF